MARIHEVLELSDKFSGAFSRFLNLGKRSGDEADKVKEKVDKMSVAGVSAFGQLAKLFTMIGGAAAVMKTIDIADQLTQTEARLAAIVSDGQDVAELQNMIFEAAQRSRGAYTDMAVSVASLKAQTGDVFKNTEEAVRFTELLNKQFAISGTSASGIQSAMYNLTQALATGVLRGNDLQMVLSNSPALIQRIADYMDVDIGKIRELASEGKVTAQIVKNAIMDAGGKIDEQFDKMPMTFGQSMQKVRNMAIKAFEPLAEKISNLVNSPQFQTALNALANGIGLVIEIATFGFDLVGQAIGWVQEHLDMILPVLGMVAAAFLIVQAVSVASAIASAGAWLIANWPLLLLIALFAGVITAAVNAGLTITDVIGAVAGTFGFFYAVVYNIFAAVWNTVASFVEFFANVWNDPLGSVARLFADVFDSILSVVETTASAIDALLGTSLSGAVSSFRGKMAGWVDSTFGESAVEIKRMANLDVGTTANSWEAKGRTLGDKISQLGSAATDLATSAQGFEIPDFDAGMMGGNVDKVGSVGKVKSVEDVKLSDEDMKLYRDLAEQRYMNRIELKTLAPNISVSIPESAAGNLSAEDVANRLKAMLVEQMAAGTAVAH